MQDETILRHVVGTGRTRVTAQVLWQGSHVVVLLTGGEAHIGCVVLAEPKSEKAPISVSVINRAGHKDEVVAVPMARQIVDAIGCPVLVSAGIHLDGITEEEIEYFVENCSLLTSLIIENVTHQDGPYEE